MKTSNTILIAIGGAFVVLVVAAILVTRSVLGSVITVPLSGQKLTIVRSGSMVTQTFKETGFSGVSAGGAWDITLSHAPKYSIVVTIPESVADRLDVQTRGGVLFLGLKPGTTVTNRRMTATITMPGLDAVHLSGANRATLSGFTGDSLAVECSGAVSVTGNAGNYHDIKIDASGASTIRFRNLPADNATVNLSGAGQAELQMTGGSLTGRLSGAGRLTYWGKVSNQTIETSGIGSVNHR